MSQSPKAPEPKAPEPKAARVIPTFALGAGDWEPLLNCRRTATGPDGAEHVRFGVVVDGDDAEAQVIWLGEAVSVPWADLDREGQ